MFQSVCFLRCVEWFNKYLGCKNYCWYVELKKFSLQHRFLKNYGFLSSIWTSELVFNFPSKAAGFDFEIKIWKIHLFWQCSIKSVSKEFCKNRYVKFALYFFVYHYCDFFKHLFKGVIYWWGRFKFIFVLVSILNVL